MSPPKPPPQSWHSADFDDDGPSQELVNAISAAYEVRKEKAARLEPLLKRCDDAIREELVALLLAIELLPSQRSAVALASNSNLVVPSDLPEWQATKRSLERLAKSIERAQSGYRAALQNPTANAVLRDVETKMRQQGGPTPNQDFDFVASWLLRLLDNATTMSGQPGKPAPHWHEAAAQMAMIFWAKYQREPAKPHFPGETNRLPKNAFSIWFCALMAAVANLDARQCRTALLKVYQPASENQKQ